ncbi:MAG: MBL fold metallo-hydrolase, partial [Pseudomonadota bacterium]
MRSQRSRSPGFTTSFWGPASSKNSLDARLSRYLSPPLFPVHFRDLPSVACHEIPIEASDIGQFKIEASLVCHPDPTLGYRIGLDDHIVAYIPDHESALCQTDGAWPNAEWISGYDLTLNADLLIHDARYTDQDYAERIGYGRSCYRHAFDFASLTNVSALVPFYHDPSHDDQTLDRLLSESLQRFEPG